MGTNFTEKETRRLTLQLWLIAVSGVMIMTIGFIINGTWSTASSVAYEEMGINMLQLATIASAYTLGSSIANFIGGFIVDKFGAKPVMAIGALTAGVLTFFIPFATSFGLLVIIRFITGLASLGYYAGITKLIIDKYPVNHRAFAHGLVMTGPSLGIVISNAVFPSVIIASGWKSVFAIGSVMILVITVFFFFAVRNDPKGSEVSVQEKVSSREKVTLRGVLQACRNRTYICGTIACFIILGASTGLNTYLLIYFMEVRGLSVIEGGAIIAASSFVGLIANSLSGIISDILKSRKKIIVPSFFITAIGIIFLIVFTGKISLITAVFIKDIFFLFATRPLNVQIAETTAGSPYVASTSGFYNAIANLGMTLGPILLGAVLEQTHDYTVLMWTIVAMICAAGVFVSFTKETYGND